MTNNLLRLMLCAAAMLATQRGFAQPAGGEDAKAKAMELRTEMQTIQKEVMTTERQMLKDSPELKQKVQDFDKQMEELRDARSAIFSAENQELAAKHARLKEIREEMKKMHGARDGKANKERKPKGEKRGKGKGKKAE